MLRPTLALVLLGALGPVTACVHVPDDIRAEFRPAEPGEPNNFALGPKGSAPPREARDPLPELAATAPAPSEAPPAQQDSPTPATSAPPAQQDSPPPGASSPPAQQDSPQGTHPSTPGTHPSPQGTPPSAPGANP